MRTRRPLVGIGLAGLGLASAVLAPWWAAAPVRAQQQELEAVERALRAGRSQVDQLGRKGEALLHELQALRNDSVAAARKAQDHEADLSAIEGRLRELEAKESVKVASLRARRVQLGHSLAALQRITLHSVDALVFAARSPIDTVRSGLLLGTTIPAIEARATALRAEIEDLTEWRREISARRENLDQTARALAGERQRLTALIRRKSAIHAATAEQRQAAAGRAARLAARAKDLRDLLDKIERESAARATQEAARSRIEAESDSATTGESRVESGAVAPGDKVALLRPTNIRPFPESGAGLTLPARGRLILRFGQARGDDNASRGIVLAARKGAQVVAPYDGRVVYAGVFRSYGRILIIEHGKRYHTLLAGLNRLDAVVGQWLLAGEPVGIVGAPREGSPEVYFELRHAGQPINPLPWLAKSDDEVRG